MASKRYFRMVAALLLSVACAKTDPVEVLPNPDPVEEDDPWFFKDISDQVQLGPAGNLTIRADLEGTRTHIEMNETETRAATVWDAGDSFRMYAFGEDHYLKYATFTTDQEGISVEFTTQNTLPDNPPYFALYPAPSKIGSSEDKKFLLGVNLPAQQNAVAGGFERGLAFAYTSAQSQDANLHFRSLVSLVRFKMSGSVVERVRNVTIKGTSSLAGDAIVAIEADGTGTLTQSRSFQSDVQSPTVTLSPETAQSFVENQDYYIVLFPGTHSFQMIFDDGEGNATTLTASEFTFKRAEINDFGTIDLGDSFTDGAVDYSPIKYMTASVQKPVTIAVIPDGFTASEMTDYEMLAKSGINALMNTEPFNSYREYFNVWILKVASNESGASITDGNGNITTRRDCYFGSRWGEKYRDMAADEEKIYSFLEEACPDISHGDYTIYDVPVLMIINDSRYGGICHTYSDGRSYSMVPYTYSGGGIMWSLPSNVPATDDPLPTSVTSDDLQNYYRKRTQEDLDEVGGYIFGDWRNTLVHEFGGHGFSRLADEYWSATTPNHTTSAVQGHEWPVPFGLNAASDPGNVRWADLLARQSELVQKSSLYNRIGTYQGGDTYMFGRWRSEKISCMIDNRFYFSTWQRMLIVKRIMALSGKDFDESSFWAKDIPTDPVRDTRSSMVMGSHPLPVREMPLLPPPVLHE